MKPRSCLKLTKTGRKTWQDEIIQIPALLVFVVVCSTIGEFSRLFIMIITDYSAHYRKNEEKNMIAMRLN